MTVHITPCIGVVKDRECDYCERTNVGEVHFMPPEKRNPGTLPKSSATNAGMNSVLARREREKARSKSM